MTDFVIAPPVVTHIPVATGGVFPVRRVYCVGRNYAEHAAEMGNTVDRSAPFYFTKSAHHVAESGATLPYPPRTANYHHEMELAVAIGAPGVRVEGEAARSLIFGYAAALDMTRRDLQAEAKEKRRPWDTAKDVEGSAVIGPITRADAAGEAEDARIWLDVNGERRQEARTSDMIHSVEAILADLSTLYRLAPGDIILTGPPAGVGPAGPGDRIEGGVDGLPPVRLTLGAAE